MAPFCAPGIDGIEYLPTFGTFMIIYGANVAKYSIHWYNSGTWSILQPM